MFTKWENKKPGERQREHLKENLKENLETKMPWTPMEEC